MKKKITAFFMASAMLFNSVQGTAALSQPTAPRLKNIPLTESYSVWGGTSIAEDGKNGSNKAYKIVSKGNGAVQFVPNRWQGFSLKDYEANGVLQFDIKGMSGGESFTIGFKSKRYNKETIVSKQSDAKEINVKVTSGWTHCEIPLKKIISGADKNFTMENVTEIFIQNGKNQTYYISELYITSPDNERQNAVIKPNQVGYEFNSEKYAMVSCFSHTNISLSENTRFDVISTADNKSKYNGKLKQVQANDSNYSGEKVFKAVFTDLKTKGEYYIKIKGADDSYKFKIAGNVYSQVLSDSLKYFYYQRQGMELTEEYAGVWGRSDLHSADSALKLLSQRNNEKAKTYDMSGGWYDAGDFGKYVTPGANAAADLLFMYELFPDLYYDGQNKIPEKGDGLPDILSEAKYELDFILKMEKGTTGGFYDLVPDPDSLPDWAGKKQRWIMDVAGKNSQDKSVVSTAASLSACAVLAQAYIVYKDFPAYSKYAEKCLAASKRAWDFVKSQNNTITYAEGAYKIDNANEINGIKLWAAGALYRATGQSEYTAYFKNNHSKTSSSLEIFNGWSKLPCSRAMMGYFNYLLSPKADSQVKSYFETEFTKYKNVLVNNHYQGNVWGIALPEWAYWWGSTGVICLSPVTVYIGNKILGVPRSEDVSVEMAKSTVNYMLGANPLAFSFVSGEGTDSVKYIFSGIYSTDNIKAIPKGYVPGGASSYDYGFVTGYPAKAYTDSDTNYTTNENAIYWNSAFAFCLSVAMAG